MNAKPLYQKLITWPKPFTVLEIMIVLIGVVAASLLYLGISSADVLNQSARSYDRDSRQMVTSASLAYVRFNALLEGNSTADINKEVYALVDEAQSLCSNIAGGGPGGQFKPPTNVPTLSANDQSRFRASLPGNTAQKPLDLCRQLSDWRGLMESRWKAHTAGQPDFFRSNYESAFSRFIDASIPFESAADPHIQQAENAMLQANLWMSVGLGLIFCLIAALVMRNRRAISRKADELQVKNELSSKLSEDLAAERKLVLTLVNHVPDAIFAKDLLSRFIIANEAAAQVMGAAKPDDLIGKTEADFLPANIAQPILITDEDIIRTGKKLIDQEECFQSPSTGKQSWRLTTKVPLIDAHSQIKGLVGVSRDITLQKLSEEALRDANIRLTDGIAELEQRTVETDWMNEMIDLLQACPSTEEACAVVADQLSRFFPKDTGELYLIHNSRNLVERASYWGKTLGDPAIFKPDDCWGLRRGRMHVVEDKALDPHASENSKSLICKHITPTGPADYLCVPLVAQGEALGMLHLRHYRTIDPNRIDQDIPDWYHATKKQRINTIVDSLSLALANLRLRETLRQQSIRDPLTGLFNRRYMEETLEREILRDSRAGEHVGVMMMDIDHFKHFNDTFGHQAGDAFLTALGHFLLTHVRGEDVACRYGGEEFILLLPGADMETTCQRAEELREKVHYLNVEHIGQSLGTVSLSFGVACFPEHGLTPDTLVHAADQALYKAKQEGRDRVVMAG